MSLSRKLTEELQQDIIDSTRSSVLKMITLYKNEMEIFVCFGVRDINSGSSAKGIIGYVCINHIPSTPSLHKTNIIMPRIRDGIRNTIINFQNRHNQHFDFICGLRTGKTKMERMVMELSYRWETM